MKILPTAISLSLLLLLSGLQAQEKASPEVKALHNKAEKQFEAVVARFAAFFEKKPRLLVAEQKGSSKDSVFYVNEYTCNKINYEVQTQQEDRVQLTANLLLSISRRDNRGCGDVAGVVMMGPKAGWNQPQGAIDNQSREKCYQQNRKAGLQEIRLEFFYQKSQWHFREALNETTGKKADLLATAIHGKSSNPVVKNFNLVWEQLAK